MENVYLAMNDHQLEGEQCPLQQRGDSSARATPADGGFLVSDRLEQRSPTVHRALVLEATGFGAGRR